MNRESLEYSENALTAEVVRGIVREEIQIEMKKEFDSRDASLSRMFGLVIDKLDQIQFDMNEYRQEGQANSRSIIKSKRNISDLDERVLKLEKAK